METGIDIVNINRIRNIDNVDGFIDKYFTNYEKEYINNKMDKFSSIAGLYAVKESLLKAFGLGIGNGLELKEIGIIHNDNGKPFVELNDSILNLLKEKHLKEIKVSISHDGEYAIAICNIL